MELMARVRSELRVAKRLPGKAGWGDIRWLGKKRTVL
jgi:hypothetical protein